MKTKTQPLPQESADYLKQACLKGMNKEQRNWANNQIKYWISNNSGEPPYGLIRVEALKIGKE